MTNQDQNNMQTDAQVIDQNEQINQPQEQVTEQNQEQPEMVASDLSQLENLVLGTLVNNSFNNVNFGTLSLDEYNLVVDTIDTDLISDNITIKFIEDEVPAVVETPNYVFFYQTATDIIIQANIEYIISTFLKAFPDGFNYDEDATTAFIDNFNTEYKNQKLAFMMYLNALAENTKENYVQVIDLGLNNETDGPNITIVDNEDNPIQMPAFPLAFADVFLNLAQPDVRVRSYDGSWLALTSETTPNDFALNLIGIVQDGKTVTHKIQLAIRS